MHAKKAIAFDQHHHLVILPSIHSSVLSHLASASTDVVAIFHNLDGGMV